MEYYFYSKEKNLKGLINTRYYRGVLKQTKEEAVKIREEKYGVSAENLMGFIYRCAAVTYVKEKENINCGYKSMPPLQIIGYTEIKDIYAE